MSKPAIIQYTFGEHDGGTKTYQFWKVGIGTKWVTIHQWGKSSACLVGAAAGGQSDLTFFGNEEGADADCFNIRRKKEKNGYRFGGSVTEEFRTLEDFKKGLYKRAGSMLAEQILTKLVFLAEDFEGLEPKTAKPKKPPKPEPPIDRGADWGAW